ncbi:MAG TPA: S-layer homology domain-containing protein [Allocoleopsis sp.]
MKADPTLKDNSTIFGGSSQSDRSLDPAVGNRPSVTSAQLPKDFPTQIPRYPNAELQNVEALTVPAAQGQLTRWSSSDPINMIQSFYQQAFESNKWQIVSQPTDTSGGKLVARHNDLEVTVTIPSDVTPDKAQPAPSATPSPKTKATSSLTAFDIKYIQGSANAASPSPQKPEVAESAKTPDVTKAPTQVSSSPSQEFIDLDKLPQTLRQQIQDLASLGVLTVDQSATKQTSNASGSLFTSNKVITRREFARWLVAANNQIFANRPGQQIRLASDTSQPAFQDVPRSDRDFPSIQALAEAGLIPSPLSGDSTAALFRPDAPLTRETLILWKVPLDTRQALPTASLDTVKQTWGFQDVTKIDPKVWRSVVADFQNGEQSNIRRVFGYTTLFQPKKTVTRAEAAAAIWYFGSQGEGLSAREALLLKNQPSPPSPKAEETPSSTNSQ